MLLRARPSCPHPCRLLAPALVCLTLGLAAQAPPESQRQAAAAAGLATPQDDDTDAILDLEFEDLLAVDLVVTSVYRAPKKVGKSAAAVFVITAEDLRRAGATSLPDALRLAPGVHVGRIDASKWAITVRGFNGMFANKLLVLMDGRSLYTPLFSGTFWDVQDTFLPDLDRIEVIRGPGAALWGANAVNGVINIITRSARDTQGGLLYGGDGTEEQGFGGFRYGGQIRDHAWFRVYGKFFNRDTGFHPDRARRHDDWRQTRLGFRTDWELTERSHLAVQGDYYDGKDGQQVTVPSFAPPFAVTVDEDMEVGGGHLLGRYTHRFSPASELAVQLYYDRTERDSPVLIREHRDTVDLDVQHRFPLGRDQQITGGVGYRVTRDVIANGRLAQFTDRAETHDLLQAFVQDEVTLVRQRLQVILGARLEHNDYTGAELQPTARLLWTPHERHTVWAAVSRAVGTPSRVGDSIVLGLPRQPGPVPGSGFFPRLLGNRDVEAENLVAYEVGYRVRPATPLSVEATAFYNVYDDLLTEEPGTPFPDPRLPPLHLVLPLAIDNLMDGETYGAEVTAEWRVMEGWRLAGTYSFLRLALHADGASRAADAEAAEQSNPRNLATLRSLVDLPQHLQFDLTGRYVDHLRGLGIGSYVQLDARLAWRPTDNLEIALVGRNLLDRSQPEYREFVIGFQPTEVERAVYGTLTLRF